MRTKAIILAISVFLLSSCTTGPKEYFKKSANNKLIDWKGSKATKRAPLYNKKYIAKAKQNVAANNYDDSGNEELDELSEEENIPGANMAMYRKVLEREIESRYLGKDRSKGNAAYPSLVRTAPRVSDRDYTENLELRAELDQIKSMLNETKNEMANYKCPTARELEKAQTQVESGLRGSSGTNGNASGKSGKNSRSNPGSAEPDGSSESTIVQPIKSI